MNARLAGISKLSVGDMEAELEQLAADTLSPQSGSSRARRLVRSMVRASSRRPGPGRRDCQRQNSRKPARCQRRSVSY
jgi:hypothetical protein